MLLDREVITDSTPQMSGNSGLSDDNTPAAKEKERVGQMVSS